MREEVCALKEIKTKKSKKNIKMLDKATDITRRAKNAYIRTKKLSEQHGHNQHSYNENSNYVNRAGDTISDNTTSIALKGEYRVKKYGKKAIEKIKNRRIKGRQIPGQTPEQTTAYSPKSPVTKPTGNAITQNFYYPGKISHKIKQSGKTGIKTIKEGSKGTVKTVKRSIKTAKYTTKTAIKTTKKAAKTTIKTAQATQRAIQGARLAARTAVISAKLAVKAIITATKAIITAVKGTVIFIMAGGWIVLVIILIMCLAGFLMGSVFGVFFSNESPSMNMPTMTEVVRQLNEEYYTEIEQIKTENPHDTFVLHSGSGNNAVISNWQEILPIYAVKTSSDLEYGMDVATLDSTKIGILCNILRDMNQISYWLETIEHEETVTSEDEDGNEIDEIVTTTETILYINLISKTYIDMIAEYSFNSEQIGMLNELMQDEYQELFVQLIEG